MVKEEIKELKNPKLRLNKAKTKFVSSSGGSAFITGLRVCHDGHVTIHREYKNRIRQLLYLYEKGHLNENQVSSLNGHLSYIKFVDGNYFTKLHQKNFTIINKIMQS